MAKTIYVDHAVVTEEKKFTFITEDVVAGGTTVGVQSTLGFTSLTTSSGQVLVIGELGQEKTEIIKTSTSSAPGGVSVTTATALRFDHPQDTKIYIVDWDRFEVQHASTVGGTKSTLMTYPEVLQPDQLESIYRDTAKTSGFYFVRFNCSIDSSNSDWSDPIPFAGYADNSVASIKKRALDSIYTAKDDTIITDEFLNESLWELRREYHQMPGKRPFRRRFNMDIGHVLTGSFRIELPNDVEKSATAENVFGVRIGTEENMEYIDKKVWDSYYVGKPRTFLTTAYTVGDQDLYCNDVRDFDDSGSISVEGTDISYTAKGISGGTLRISVDGDWVCSIGSDVWQNVSYGLPDSFTVWADVGGSSYVYFNRPLETAYINQNIFCDYYRMVVPFDSDYDELDEPVYDMFVPGLAWKIKKRKDPSIVDTNDPDFQRWQVMKQQAWQNEYVSTEIRFDPQIDHLL